MKVRLNQVVEPCSTRKKRGRVFQLSPVMETAVSSFSLEAQTNAKLHAAAAQRHGPFVIEGVEGATSGRITRVFNRGIRQIAFARHAESRIRVVECVEKFGPQLQPYLLADLRILEDAEVELIQRRP